MRVYAGLFAGLVSCTGILSAELDPVRDTLPIPKLKLTYLSGDPEQLACRFDDAQLDLLEKLNRIDRDQLAKLEQIVVPERWDLPEDAYSPLPPWFTWASYFPKAIVVSRELQAFGAYKDGLLERWGPVSTGAQKSPTPDGMFHLNWRSKGHRSTVNRSWFLKWYFNFSNATGHSFHEYELPGGPASHGCVRMLSRDAKWLYDWGQSWTLDDSGRKVETAGTPVLILGEYDHGSERPWLDQSRFDQGPLALENVALPPSAVELLASQLGKPEGTPVVPVAPETASIDLAESAIDQAFEVVIPEEARNWFAPVDTKCPTCAFWLLPSVD